MEFSDNDLIIGLKSSEGVMPSEQMRVYAKKGKDFIQIGIIESMALKASAKIRPVTVKVSLPGYKGLSDVVLNLVNRYSSLLSKLGCKVKIEK